MSNTAYTDDPKSANMSSVPPKATRVAPYEPVQEEQYEESTPVGLLSTPGRAFALGGSLIALLAVFAAVVFLLSARGNSSVPVGAGSGAPPITGNNTGASTGAYKVPVISNVSQSGALSKGSVPPNFEWTDGATGQKMSLATMKGKPVWINFWGTWCPPCRAEMPEMQKVYNKHMNDVAILGVSMGPRDDPGQVIGFLNQFKYNWTFIHDGDSQLALKYQASAIPMSYFVGSDGTIKAVSVGGIQADRMEGLLSEAK